MSKELFQAIALQFHSIDFRVDIKFCLQRIENCQIHDYRTRTANNYRVHHCRTNLKKFPILYQGPKIWKSLPVTITSLSSFSNFKTRLLEIFSKIITELAKPHTVALSMYAYCYVRGDLNYKPGGFYRSPRHTL